MMWKKMSATILLEKKATAFLVVLLAFFFPISQRVLSVNAGELASGPKDQVTVEQVFQGLRKAEQSIRTAAVTIEFDKEMYFERPEGRPLKRYFIGQWMINSNGLARYDGLGAKTMTHPETDQDSIVHMKWIGVYDGQVAKMFESRRDGSFCSGRIDIRLAYDGIRPENFTTTFFDSLVSDLISKKGAIIAGHAELDGRSLVVVETTPVKKKHEWKNQFWVDPERNFTIYKRAALVRFNGEDVWKEYTRTFSTDQEEVAEDIWLPTHFRYESLDVSPGESTSEISWWYEGHASHWVINEKLSQSLFAYEFPPGTQVHDLRPGANPVEFISKLTSDRAKGQTQREPIYDPQIDAKAQISAALERARREHKHVLLDYGGNWCGWCYKLHDVFTKNDEITPIIHDKYVLVMVDVNSNQDVLLKYDKEEKQHGYPFLTVLDANGNVLINKDTSDLEQDTRHSVKKVTAFLTKWAPRAK